MRSNALVLIALLALIGNAWGQTSGKVGMDIKTMPACAGYDADLGGCPVYQKASGCPILTADGVVAPDAGQLISIVITNASAANDDILIYDNASAASGTVIVDMTNVAAGTTVVPNIPAPFENGAYLDLTTAGSMVVQVCRTH